MKFYLYVLLICFYSNQSLKAQNKQDYIWLFGFDKSSSPYDLGFAFDFNIKPFQVVEKNVGIGMGSCGTTICDVNGNLLFYTNGCAVLNRNAEIMPNGDNLNNDIWKDITGWNDCNYGYPQRQDLLILPSPSNRNEYYIVHKTKIFNGYNSDDSLFMRYTIVDITLDDGLGDVVHKDIDFYKEKNSLSGYLTAILHENKRDYWILQPIEEDSIIVTFLLTENGIERKEDQNTHVYLNRNRSSASGTAKFSPDGQSYALFNYFDQLHLYNFDRSTGILSKHKKVIINDNVFVDQVWRFGSVEWSPNSRFIYTVNSTQLHQIDTYADSKEGVFLIDEYNGTTDPFSTNFNLMALGPDCRIYIAPGTGYSYHVIKHPDNLGLECDFVQNGIFLPGSHQGEMPNFPRFRVDANAKCDSTITSVFGFPVYFSKSLKIYPNLASNILTIDLPEAINGSISISDINGIPILKKHINFYKNIITLDISSIPSGFYTVELIIDEKRIIYTNKVVIN